METTPESGSLIDELLERMAVLRELNGPQIEAWASGLFALFEDLSEVVDLLRVAAIEARDVAELMARSLLELTSGVEPELHDELDSLRAELGLEPTSASSDRIGSSILVRAWRVEAPFGRSIILGFDPADPAEGGSGEPADRPGAELEGRCFSRDTATIGGQPAVSPGSGGDDRGVQNGAGDEDADELAHSILVELNDSGAVEDLQLAGPARSLIEEAVSSDTRVGVETLETSLALELVADGWPPPVVEHELGPGFSANQAFVRRRVVAAGGALLHEVRVNATPVDVRRGLDDAEFAAANRSALSTLRAAVGVEPESFADHDDAPTEIVQAWIGVIRGDGGELSARERDALLWLEWADWLGAGIGLIRAGAGSKVDGAAMVDHVNRCPEVSSTIDKRDRDYAEWAFEVALDLLRDAGAVDAGVLTPAGHAALLPAMRAAWE